MPAVMAERVSLSPNLISETESVSFSLTIGIVPMFRSSMKVFWAFRYWVLSAMSLRVRRIWAMFCRRCMKSWSQRLMSLHCPIAASAWTWGRCFGLRSKLM